MRTKQDKQAILGLSTCCGILVGGFIGFLLRPSAFLVGQLPFAVVITSGKHLQGIDSLLIPIAQRSFDHLLTGVIVGAVAGFILPLLFMNREQEPKSLE